MLTFDQPQGRGFTSSADQPAVADSNTAPASAGAGSPALQKLDADLYAATEVQGAAESLSGSGNINFLTLQGAQNDSASVAGAAAEAVGSDLSLASLGTSMLSGYGFYAPASEGVFTAPAAPDVSFDSLSSTGVTRDLTAAATATPPAPAPAVESLQQGFAAQNLFSGGGGDASVARADLGNGAPGPAGIDGVNGTLGANGVDGTNGLNGSNGNNGMDGANGAGGSGPVDIDIINNFGDIIINPVVNVFNDVNILQDIDLNILNDVNITKDLSLLNDIDIIFNDIIDIDLDILNNTIVNVTATLTNTVNTSITSIVSILDNILQPNPGSGGDTDLHVDLGLGAPIDLNPVIDVILDPVETIIGDIDINIDVDTNLQDGTVGLGLDGILAGLPLPPVTVALDLPTLPELAHDPAAALQDTVDSLTDTLGGLTGLLGDNAEGDTDLHADLGLGAPVDLNPVIDVVLDPVEALVADIDVNLDAALDLAEGNLALGLDGVLAEAPLPDIAVDLDLPTLPEVAHDPLGAVTETVDSLLDTLGGPGGLAPVAEPLLGAAIEPVEAIAGDIDAGALVENVPAYLVDNALGAVADVAGGILDPAPPQAADSDLGIALDAALGGVALPPVAAEINLDIVESIAGDIDIDLDLDVTAALDALTQGAEGIEDTLGHVIPDALDEALGGLSGGDIWPESPLGGIEDVVDSVLGGQDGGLLAPVGSVAEGLGILDIVNLGGGGGSGGHQGGGLFGGLFG